MKVEVPTGYRMGEITYAAGVLVDELVKIEIPGTQVWPYFREQWINHIRGIGNYRNLKAQGLTVGYRGYLDNISQISEMRGISLILEEPKIIVFADEEILKPEQIIGVDDVLHQVASDYDLTRDLPPKSLVFSKEEYAKQLVVFDSKDLNIS